MLPKKNRIRASSFDTLLKQGRSIHGRFVSLSYTRAMSDFPSVFAIVVSKAVAKRAVDRNRLRRQSYACIRERIATIAPGYACIFFLKKGARGIPYQKLCAELTALLAKASLTR